MPKAKARKSRSVSPASKGAKPAIAPVAAPTPAEVTEKIKELVRVAQDQGHLTYGDIHEVFPEDSVTPQLLDEVSPWRLRLSIRPKQTG